MTNPAFVQLPMEDGDVRLLAGFLDQEDGDELMACLQQDVPWSQPVITLFGRSVASPRMAAWYGDSGAVYRYSGLENRPLPWLDPLNNLRRKLEAITKSRFNSVLLNLYRTGDDAMGWHSDDEKSLGVTPAIASVSIGAVRRFRMRHRFRKSVAPVSLDLTHGSLMLMAGETQKYWKHAVMRTSKPVGPRINLTFRNILHCDDRPSQCHR